MSSQMATSNQAHALRKGFANSAIPIARLRISSAPADIRKTIPQPPTSRSAKRKVRTAGTAKPSERVSQIREIRIPKSPSEEDACDEPESLSKSKSPLTPNG